MARGEFITPTLTYSSDPAGEDFIKGFVPSMSPETFDPEVATEELECAQARESEMAAAAEIDVLNSIWELESEGER
jgi:hypothetical protein